ncbi:MAG: hypothetical protein ACLUEV_09920 [Alistipes sp.]
MPRAGSFLVAGGDWVSIRPIYASPEELSNEFFVPQAVDSQVFGRDSGSRTTIRAFAAWTLRGRRFRKTGNLGSGRRRR